MDSLPLRTLCSLCGWEYLGTALEGREQAVRHRAQAHPEIVFKRKRPGRHLKSFVQPKLNKQDWLEVYAERDKRAKLLGIEISTETP
jgi:hypothetical protein